MDLEEVVALETRHLLTTLIHPLEKRMGLEENQMDLEMAAMILKENQTASAEAVVVLANLKMALEEVVVVLASLKMDLEREEARQCFYFILLYPLNTSL